MTLETHQAAPSGVDEQLAVPLPEMPAIAIHFPVSPRENHAHSRPFQPETFFLNTPALQYSNVPVLVPPLPALYGLFRAKKINKNFLMQMRANKKTVATAYDHRKSALAEHRYNLAQIFPKWLDASPFRTPRSEFRTRFGAEFLTKAVHHFSNTPPLQNPIFRPQIVPNNSP